MALNPDWNAPKADTNVKKVDKNGHKTMMGEVKS